MQQIEQDQITAHLAGKQLARAIGCGKPCGQLCNSGTGLQSKLALTAVCQAFGFLTRNDGGVPQPLIRSVRHPVLGNLQGLRPPLPEGLAVVAELVDRGLGGHSGNSP